MSTHANLSPSKRHRWALCPGSIREEAKFPDERTSEAAIDGTHSHTLLEHCLSEGVEPESMVGQALSDDDGVFTVDDEYGNEVFRAHPEGDGIFEPEERDQYLNLAKLAIDRGAPADHVHFIPNAVKPPTARANGC